MIAGIFNKDLAFVLAIFSLSPGSRIFRKELQERTKLNNLGLDNALNILVNAGIIIKNGRHLSLNLENARQVIDIMTKDYKLLKEIPLDAYFCLLSVVFFLQKLKGVDAYLFGSYAKLVFKEGSDIDIAVISDRISQKEKKDIAAIAQKAHKRYKKKIELHFFGRDFYKNKSDPFVAEVLKHGVRVI
ncbi:MAG: nucleotidyltransferase domain-containing protein [Nanoarchaeota archaeon]